MTSYLLKRVLLIIVGTVLVISQASSFDLGGLPVPKVPTIPGVDPKVTGLVARSGESLNKADEDLTPVQQYYLGRAFSATIMQSRKPVNNPAANAYINDLGQALALASEQPETYSGYRFQILDSPEVNAFSGPGGFVLVTKGLVKLTHNEAELAAVLAHEIGHVALEHGVKAIQKDRQTGALVGVVADTAKTLGPDELKGATAAFEGSVTDLTKNVVDKGYSRDTEFEADARAVTVLRRAGYSPRALLSMLEELKAMPQGSGPGIAKTHPAPQDRINQANKLVAGDPPVTASPAQDQRYHAALDGL